MLMLVQFWGWSEKRGGRSDRSDTCHEGLQIPLCLDTECTCCPAEAMQRETTEILAVLMQDQGLSAAWGRTTGRDATVAVVIWRFTCI